MLNLQRLLKVDRILQLIQTRTLNSYDSEGVDCNTYLIGL